MKQDVSFVNTALMRTALLVPLLVGLPNIWKYLLPFDNCKYLIIYKQYVHVENSSFHHYKKKMKIEEHFGEHLDIDSWKWEAMLVYLSIFILFYVLMIKRYTFINISMNNFSNISRWNIIYKFSYHLQLSCISNTIIIWIISN